MKRPRKNNAFQLVLLLVLTCTLTASAASARTKTGMDWYLLGRSLQEQEKFDAAFDAYQHALDMKFQPAGALLRMAQIAALRGDSDEAMRRLDMAFDINPVAVGLLPQLGGIPTLAGDPRFKELMVKAERARHPCKNSPESAQFDFWLGDWTVTNPRGQVVGHNQVTHDLEGCVLRESWTDSYGNRGTSVNFYDPASAMWHQVWTSDNGTITHYEGRLSGGAMRFRAGGFGDADGKTHFRRMTFTPNGDGSVRQFIEDSNDGKTWTTSFDGLYRKNSQPAAPSTFR